MMDLKIKGKSWAGSIYQKFEAMCQDVDGFVNKDKVKYVGNQVQNVGVGVKKLYSDVVQDLLPPVEKALTEKKNDVMGTYFRSIVGIKEETLCDIDEKSGKQNVIDLLDHCSSTSSCDADPERQFLSPPGTDLSEAVTGVVSEHDFGAAVYENADVSIDKIVANEEQLVSASGDRSSLKPSLDSTNHHHIHTTLPEVSSPISPRSCEPEMESNFVWPLVTNPFKEAEVDLVLEHAGDAAVNENLDISIDTNVESEEAVTENRSYSEDRKVCYSSLNSTDHYDIDTSLPEVSSQVSQMCREPDPQKKILVPRGVNTSKEAKTDSVSEHIRGAAVNEIVAKEESITEKKSYTEDGSFFASSQDSNNRCPSLVSPHESGSKFCIEGTVHDILSPGCQFSDISWDHIVARPEVTSFRSPPSTEPVNRSDSFDPSSAQNPESLSWSYTCKVGHASNMTDISYSASGPILASQNKDVSMLSSVSNSFLSSESNDAYSNLGLSFAVGSSDSKNEQCSESTPLEALIPSSLTGMDDSIGDVSDPSMETIDLSDKMKVHESCVAVEHRLILPVSSGARSFRSYKKLLKDAFALRKRLTKEYEQLAIWYGDIDEEASHHFGMPPSPLPSSVCLPESSIQDTWESEWELL